MTTEISTKPYPRSVARSQSPRALASLRPQRVALRSHLKSSNYLLSQ